MRTEVILIGLILSAVVMISRVAPMALLGQRELPVRLRRLIETLPGCEREGVEPQEPITAHEFLFQRLKEIGLM